MSMTHKTIGTKTLLGTRKSDGVKIYLSPASWDCNWYWAFGYLGNNQEHYHLSGYANGRNINMYDALMEDYDLNPVIAKHLWTFCEIVQTVYTLKKSAEVLGRGGSHYTTNPCKDIIINTDEVTRINEVVIPALLEKLYELVKGD